MGGLNCSTWMPAVCRRVKNSEGRREGADAVVDEVNPHSLLCLGDQQVAEPLAVAAHILEDVVLEVQIMLRAANRGKHRREGLLAITQDPDCVAGEQRTFGNRLLHCQVALQRAASGACAARRVRTAFDCFFDSGPRAPMISISDGECLPAKVSSNTGTWAQEATTRQPDRNSIRLSFARVSR